MEQSIQKLIVAIAALVGAAFEVIRASKDLDKSIREDKVRRSAVSLHSYKKENEVKL